MQLQMADRPRRPRRKAGIVFVGHVPCAIMLLQSRQHLAEPVFRHAKNTTAQSARAYEPYLRNDDRIFDAVMGEAHMVGRSFELRRDRRDEHAFSVELTEYQYRPLKGSVLAVLLGADIEPQTSTTILRAHARTPRSAFDGCAF